MDEDDEDLLERYVRGETEALSLLVDRYRKPLYGFILRMAVSEHDADEVFQEVWLRVIRKAASFRRDRFRGWVYRIAHNLIIDHARRRKNVVSMDAPAGGESMGTLVDNLPAAGPSPAAGAQENELGTRIREAVRLLTPEQREVFVLRVDGDVPFREIARIQGVPINTALARMQYALQKLRVLLRQERVAMEDGR